MANRRVLVNYVCSPTAATDVITAFKENSTCVYIATVASARFCRSGLPCPEWATAPAPPPPPPEPTASHCRAPQGVTQPLEIVTTPNTGGDCPDNSIKNGDSCYGCPKNDTDGTLTGISYQLHAPYRFIGCYVDSATRAMPNQMWNNHWVLKSDGTKQWDFNNAEGGPQPGARLAEKCATLARQAGYR